MSTPSLTRHVTAAEVTPAPELEACRDIHCDFNATCELGPDRFPRCSCKFDCAAIAPDNMQPVCGSDLRVYASKCHMLMQACQRQQELRLRPLELCQGSLYLFLSLSSFGFFARRVGLLWMLGCLGWGAVGGMLGGGWNDDVVMAC